MAVALYCRISLDVAGEALGVARQEQDTRALAERKGWSVAYVATENDVSAYKRKPRPQFERVIADLASGVIDGVVVYDCDRLARQPTDLERLIELYEQRPLKFATVTQEIDLSTPDGRFIARLMVNFANKSSADTARRVTRTHLQLAMNGVPVGGHRPFGYEADKRTLKPDEAQLIQQAAKDILAGVGLHTIARRWNEQGIKTTAGNPWRKQVLRNMLLSPRLAGYRVYRRKIAVGENGPVTGLYPPILDVDTWEAVGAVLRDPSRGLNTHTGGRKYLLTGIVRCGLCGATLAGNADTKYQTFSYSCKSVTNGGCGKVSISGPKLDELITNLILAYLSDREVESKSEPWGGETELEDLSRRVQELMDAYAKRELSSDVVFPTVSKLEEQAARLRLDRAAWLRKQVSLSSRPTNATEAWPNLDTDQRRTVIGSVLHSVAIKPSAGRGGRFDESRAEPVWRE